MRLVDEAALETLRKADDGQTPDWMWDEIAKQVDEHGIDGLSGTAAALVEGIVRKKGRPNPFAKKPAAEAAPAEGDPAEEDAESPAEEDAEPASEDAPKKKGKPFGGSKAPPFTKKP